MIKSVIQAFVFVFISIRATQSILGAFTFLFSFSTLLLVLALALLYLFMRPLLRIVSLPSSGVGYLVMSFIMTTIVLYVLRLFIPGFTITSTTVPELLIFGFVLPSKNLTVTWAIVFSALLIATLMWFFYWLSSSSQKHK